MAFLTGWHRRKPITISGTTAGPQTNYQMMVNVNKGPGTDIGNQIFLGGNVRDDFSDLRFTLSDELTLLNYWIESINPGISAIVWVLIPSIPASPGTGTIFIYYDNPTAISLSNPGNTFIYFDNFNDPLLPGWTKIIGPNYPETISALATNSLLTVNTSVADSCPNGSYAVITSAQQYNPNIAIRVRNSDNPTSWYPGGFGFGLQVAPVGQMFNNVLRGIATRSQYHLQTAKGAIATPIPGPPCGDTLSGVESGPNNTFDGNFHITDVIWTPTRTELIVDGISNARSINTAVIPTIPLNINIGDTGQYGGGPSSSITIIDWLAVRKASDPEPAITTIGAEQTSLITTTGFIINREINNVLTCTEPCTVTGTITWTNTGPVAGTFTPAILVDSTKTVLGPVETLASQGVSVHSFTSNLNRGSYTICADPGPLCKTVNVSPPTQAGFGTTGLLLLGGLALGFLLLASGRRECSQITTIDECQRNADRCQIVDNRCIRR